MAETVGRSSITQKVIQLLWWFALAASLALLAASLPGYLRGEHVADATTEFSSWARVGIWLGILLSLSAAGLSISLACLFFWKKRNDPMGLFLAYYLLMYGIMLCGPMERLLTDWLPQFPYLGALLQTILFTVPGLALILVFPNGHFVPRWTRVLVPVAAILILVTLTFDLEESAKLNTLRAQVIHGILFAIILLALYIQSYRYRKLYTPLERRQTRWVTYGGVLWLALLAVLAIPYYYFLNDPSGTGLLWWAPFGGAAWWLTLNLFPISFAIAILRSRLWDIDVIIRRTVLYALITTSLLIVFFGSVILLQRIFSAITNSGQNEIVTVLSTLIIAALFVPLRTRIQNLIDRRFNRNRYDAQQVLNDFANTVRDETDLEKLTGRLMEVVHETMQPRSVSVWLKATDDRRRRGNQ